MEEKIVIDKKTLKAIVVESRLNILKLLSQKDYTLTDIAELLELKSSTVKEHLDILDKAGLVKKEETDRKWKYYSLTFKGKMIVKPMEIKIMFAFVVTLAVSFGLAISYFKKVLFIPDIMLTAPNLYAAKAMGGAAPAADMAESVVVEEIMTEQARGTFTNLPSYFSGEIISLILLVFFIALSAFLLGIYLKKSTIIINKGGENK